MIDLITILSGRNFLSMTKSFQLPKISLLIVLTVAALIMGIIYAMKSFVASRLETVSTHVSWVIDINNPREVVGYANNVFIGKVVRETGVYFMGGSSIPHTSFSVTVLKNIKGELPSTVEVRQGGGVNKQTNELILVDKESILKIDGVYLFATTRQGNDVPWQYLLGGYEKIYLHDASIKERVIREYEQAYRDETPYIHPMGLNTGIPYVAPKIQHNQLPNSQ